MTTLDLTAPAPARASRHLRLDTLVRLRWLAIAGQSVAVAGVHFGLGFLLPFGWCFGVIAISAWLNIALRVRFPLSHRLNLFDRMRKRCHPGRVDRLHLLDEREEAVELLFHVSRLVIGQLETREVGNAFDV